MPELILFQWYTSVVARVALVFSALLLAANSAAHGADRIVQSMALPVGFYDPKVQGDGEPFPGYAESCGYKIFLKSTRHVSEADRFEDGTEVIFIDPLLTKAGNEFHKAFLIAHECAHHRLGHTTAEGLSRRSSSHRAVADQELSADCWAAEILSRAGLSGFTATMSNRMQRGGRYSPGSGYPGGIQRASIIQQCAAAGEGQYLGRPIKASITR